ncbi:GGDEF domain-containing protein [Dyella monticola]|nr:GGDEF domain-containing protein [Dyella monticola]
MAMALGALVQPCHGTTKSSITDPAAFLSQAEALHRKDHPRFVQMLAQIHSEAPPLTAQEQWRLRYLDAWETMFEGNYIKSEAQLRNVIDHSGDAVLIAKASALLLSNLGVNQRYEEAFALANHLTSELPTINDPVARYSVLMNLSQILDFAGQIDLAIHYAQMMQDAMPPGESPCLPYSMQIAALYNGKRLTSASSILQQGIDACVGDHQPVITNSARLVLSNLYLDENQPAKTIALLDQVEPSIQLNHYYPHMLSSLVQRAEAYAKLGDDADAKKAALAAVALGHPGEISEWLMVAYDVLYKIEKQHGNAAAALDYYEHYASQDKSYYNDISARTMAYEMAQQHVLAQQLETEKLNKQNSILRLQQALSTKAMETSRLYIILLLLCLGFVVFWLLKLKRSQLRFKELSYLDGLTGIFNHQHFISEADHALRLLQKKTGSACLIFIDLDHFKQVNDTHGHAIGDTVLKHTITICKQHLRPTDLFGRLGGEEFGILLLECSRDQAIAIADRIRLAIEATPVDAEGSIITFSVSVGLASTDTSGYELQRLCREADAALYRAKRTGRNRVIVHGELVEA